MLVAVRGRRIASVRGFTAEIPRFSASLRSETNHQAKLAVFRHVAMAHKSATAKGQLAGKNNQKPNIRNKSSLAMCSVFV